MKPRGDALISALKGIHESQHRRWGFEEKTGVYHKKAEEVYLESVTSQTVSRMIMHHA